MFSIIIPTYNRAYVLWKAVQSVLAQTELCWEVIIVNDGSTDCTLRLLEEFSDARIRVFTTPNQGASAARNYGVKLAQSPFIAYLDSDNIWHPNFLETMRGAIEQNDGCVLWYCGQNYTCYERTANGKWLLISREAETGKQYTVDEIWRMKGADTNCMVHRREILDVVGGWDEQCRWGEDWDLFLRFFLAFPGKIKWIPHILVEYRQVFGTGADGVCAEARENVDEEIKLRRYLLQKWKHHPDFAAFKSLEKKAEDLLLMRAKVYRAVEQVIGREGETATFFSSCLLNSELRVIGFAPRQFRRDTAKSRIVWNDTVIGGLIKPNLNQKGRKENI